MSEKRVSRRRDDETTDDEVVIGEMADQGEDEELAKANVRGYLTGEWRGLPQLRCNLCQWDTLNGEQAMREHIESAHPKPVPPPAVRAMNVDVLDRFGNKIETIPNERGE